MKKHSVKVALLFVVVVILAGFSFVSCGSDSGEGEGESDGDTPDGDGGADGDESGDGDVDGSENGDGDTEWPIDGDYDVDTSALALNEVDCQGRDWVEIYNRSDEEIDISSWLVADDLDKSGHQYAIPSGTKIAAGGFYTAEQEDTEEAGFSFGIKCGADLVYLVAPGGAVVDQTSVPDLPDDTTWGRLPDGSGSWQQTIPTKNEANRVSDTPVDPDMLFDPLNVYTVELTLSEDAESDLTSDPYEYTQADFKFIPKDGTEITLEGVGVRLKSGSSYEPLTGKAAFKVRFDKYDEYLKLYGLKNITLNNMVEDQSMMHETLAYRIFRAAGVPAPRTGYAWVKVNGEDFGLYVVVEKYDDVFAEEYFDSTQHIYEGSGKDLQTGLVSQFEIDEGDEIDTSDLQALIAAINNSSQGEWFNEVSAVADLTEMTRMWAVEDSINHFDGYTMARNNYFLHSDDSGKFSMMPWGADRAFAADSGSEPEYSIMLAKCLLSSECKARYDAEKLALEGVISSIDIDSWLGEIDGVIKSYVEADERKPYSVQDYETALQALKDYY